MNTEINTDVHYPALGCSYSLKRPLVLLMLEITVRCLGFDGERIIWNCASVFIMFLNGDITA